MKIGNDIKRLKAVIEQAEELTKDITRGVYGKTESTACLGMYLIHLAAHARTDITIFESIIAHAGVENTVFVEGAPFEHAARQAEENLAAIYSTIEEGYKRGIFPDKVKS